MSLLEDVFLEDEAGEAQELERVIEGDEFDERPAALSEDSDDNSAKEDEAEEDKRRVDPTATKQSRVSKNPRFILNPAQLTGPRGIQVIPDHFKDFKFKGKGHEKEDLDLVLKKLEHWAYRLYPKFQFEDCLKKIETLGKKRPVMVHLHKIRSDQYISDDVVVQKDSSDDEGAPQPPAEEDEFDKLLQQQIELARATPAPSSAKKQGFGTPRFDVPSFSMPKATSSPSISEDQKERMLRNRQLAEERRLARLKNSETSNISIINEAPIEVEDNLNGSTDRNKDFTIVNETPIVVESHQNEIRDVTILNEVPIDVEAQNGSIGTRNKNRSNVIDSSDEDCEELVVNESITVDVHDTRPNRRMADDRDSESYNRSDEDIQENGIIDDEITVNHVSVDEPMKKRPNVIESSDDESYDGSSNNPIRIDTRHNIDDSHRDKSPTKVINDKDSDSNSEVTNQRERDVDEVKENVDTANGSTNENIVRSEEINNDKDQNTNVEDSEMDELPVHTDKTANMNEKSNAPQNNKENVDTNTDLEIMDVDFNEEF